MNTLAKDVSINGFLGQEENPQSAPSAKVLIGIGRGGNEENNFNWWFSNSW